MSSPETVWHARFVRQAGWTRPIRESCFRRFVFIPGDWILEAGCGTGAVTAELSGLSGARAVGLDLDLRRLVAARAFDPSGVYLGGDAYRLPFPDGTFAMSVCHYLLLWLAEPVAVLREMARVTRPGGRVAALAEPDHAGRIDAPAPLDSLGRWQTFSLERQGADVRAGRMLAGWMSAAGLEDTEGGLLGAEWAQPRESDWEAEWQQVQEDLTGMVPVDRLDAFRAAEVEARARGGRVLFVPTFWASGKKP